VIYCFVLDSPYHEACPELVEGTPDLVMDTYKTASLDRKSLTLTLIITGATALAAIIALVQPGEVRITALTVAVCLFLVCAGTFCMAPAAYLVAHDKVVVKKRLWFSTAIPMSHIKKCYPYPQLSTVRTLKLAGNGGAFGWYGFFSCDELGPFRIYATNKSKAVIIENDTKFAVSPERPESFVAAVREYASMSGTGND
jgi:hypothetical protein